MHGRTSLDGDLPLAPSLAPSLVAPLVPSLNPTLTHALVPSLGPSLIPSLALSPLLSALSLLPFMPSPSQSPFLPSSPAPTVLASRYEPPRSWEFTEIELSQGLNKVTRETIAHRIIKHPRDAIVEYPETGDSPGIAVAHIFNIDPNSFYHPRFNFQYSLGDGHGGHHHITCRLLRSTSGMPSKCSKLRITCKSIYPCFPFHAS